MCYMQTHYTYNTNIVKSPIQPPEESGLSVFPEGDAWRLVDGRIGETMSLSSCFYQSLPPLPHAAQKGRGVCPSTNRYASKRVTTCLRPARSLSVAGQRCILDDMQSA